MKQKVSIDVDASNFSSFPTDGQILLYDKNQRCYYATTREKFMRTQNEKIKALEDKYMEFEKKVEAYIEEMKQKEKQFLLDYQETNQTVIDLVKSLMEEK